MFKAWVLHYISNAWVYFERCFCLLFFRNKYSRFLILWKTDYSGGNFEFWGIYGACLQLHVNSSCAISKCFIWVGLGNYTDKREEKRKTKQIKLFATRFIEPNLMPCLKILFENYSYYFRHDSARKVSIAQEWHFITTFAIFHHLIQRAYRFGRFEATGIQFWGCKQTSIS